MRNSSRKFPRTWQRLINRQKEHFGVKLPISKRLLPVEVRDLILSGRYEAAEASLLMEVICPDDRVLELGTGIGFMSSLACRFVPYGSVTTVEASEVAINIARHTFELNGVAPHLVLGAVSVAAGTGSFLRADNLISGRVTDASDDQSRCVQVDMVSLDSLLGTAMPSLIVCDIEGAEIEVLSSSSLSGVRKILVEFHPRKTGVLAIQGVQDHLQSRGFRLAAGNVAKVAYFERA